MTKARKIKLEGELEGLAVKKGSLDEALKSLEATRVKLGEMAKGLRLERVELERELKGLEVKEGSLEEALKSLEATRVKLGEMAKGLRLEKVELERELKGLELKKGSLDAETQGLEAKRSTLSAEMKEQEVQAEELKQQRLSHHHSEEERLNLEREQMDQRQTEIIRSRHKDLEDAGKKRVAEVVERERQEQTEKMRKSIEAEEELRLRQKVQKQGKIVNTDAKEDQSISSSSISRVSELRDQNHTNHLLDQVEPGPAIFDYMDDGQTLDPPLTQNPLTQDEEEPRLVDRPPQGDNTAKAKELDGEQTEGTRVQSFKAGSSGPVTGSSDPVADPQNTAINAEYNHESLTPSMTGSAHHKDAFHENSVEDDNLIWADEIENEIFLQSIREKQQNVGSSRGKEEKSSDEKDVVEDDRLVWADEIQNEIMLQSEREKQHNVGSSRRKEERSSKRKATTDSDDSRKGHRASEKLKKGAQKVGGLGRDGVGAGRSRNERR